MSRIELKGTIEYENAGNGYYFTWVKINGRALADILFQDNDLPWKFEGKIIIEMEDEIK